MSNSFDVWSEPCLEREKLRSYLDRSDWMIRKEFMADSGEFGLQIFNKDMDLRNSSNKPGC